MGEGAQIEVRLLLRLDHNEMEAGESPEEAARRLLLNSLFIPDEDILDLEVLY